MLSLVSNKGNIKFNLSRLCLSILIVLLAFESVHAEINVVCEEGCRHNSINGAIEAAKPGDVIEVLSGTYIENVNISKPITLRAIDTGKGRPVVRAKNEYNDTMVLSADGIILEGFMATKAVRDQREKSAGIKVTSNDNVISDNLVTDNSNGIYLIGSENSTLIGALSHK